MKTVVSAVLSFSSLAFTLSAQQNPFFAPLVQVKQFFQLSDPQLRTILMNNDEYNRWSFEKQNRIRQVQTEIVEETTIGQDAWAEWPKAREAVSRHWTRMPLESATPKLSRSAGI